MFPEVLREVYLMSGSPHRNSNTPGGALPFKEGAIFLIPKVAY